jgi:hypothetical protein
MRRSPYVVDFHVLQLPHPLKLVLLYIRKGLPNQAASTLCFVELWWRNTIGEPVRTRLKQE